jgi:hypothetical protein
MDDGRRSRSAGVSAAEVEVPRLSTLAAPHLPSEIAPSEIALTAEPSSEGRPAAYLFAAPALVLLAAVAIFEGYLWLHLIPGGSLRPSGLLFAVGIVPVTFALTRGDPDHRSRLCRLTRLCATPIPLLGMAFLVSHATPCARLLGAASLALAVSTLALTAASEYGGTRRSPSP